jgi:hypothetical protein
MFTMPSVMAPALAAVPAWALLIALVAISLALIFAGGTLVKVVAFLVVGFVGADFGGALAAQYLPTGWGLVGLVLGFAVGGLLGVALISVGIGLVVAYGAYLFALSFGLPAIDSLVVGVVFFVVGLALAEKLLTLGTAIAGGLLLFDVLTQYGVGVPLSTVIAAALTLMGVWIQLTPQKRMSQPTATSVGGQPSDRQ